MSSRKAAAVDLTRVIAGWTASSFNKGTTIESSAPGAVPVPVPHDLRLTPTVRPAHRRVGSPRLDSRGSGRFV
jgi:hypothetical protein